jgi:hypothetical protein
MITVNILDVISLILLVILLALGNYLLYRLYKLQYQRRKFLREHMLKEDYNEYCRIGNKDYEDE